MEWAQREKSRSYLSRDIYVQDLGLCAAKRAGAAHARRRGAADGLSCRQLVRPHPAVEAQDLWHGHGTPRRHPQVLELRDG